MALTAPETQEVLAYLSLLKDHQGTLELFNEFEPTLKKIEIVDVFGLFSQKLGEGETIEEILSYVDRFIHAIDPLLRQKESDLPHEGLIGILTQENQQLVNRLNQLQAILKAQPLAELDQASFAHEVQALEAFSCHYVKLQNLLFPSLEKVDARYEGLKILWSLQDQAKKDLKALIACLEDPQSTQQALAIALGQYFFTAFGLIQKENRFLLQAAHQSLSVQTLNQLLAQSLEYPYFEVEKPTLDRAESKTASSGIGFETETGSLSFEQLELLLNIIPLDCTFIDEHNKVRYFNKAQDRVFPRSPAVIGRDVRNCHPANSVHVVNRIIEAFRNNTQNEAKFWIQMKGQFVLIRYFALRDANQVYKGTLEVTQVVNDIRSLEGERRLLDWE